MDEYLDDTVKLSDICLALNVEISKLEYFQLLVHYAMHLLDFSDGVGLTTSSSMSKVLSKS